MARNVAFYIDGLNLYHGMIDAGLERFRWLDVGLLANCLVDPGDTVAFVRYFNTPAWADDKRLRQETYLQALQMQSPNVTIHLGEFKAKYWYCDDCNASNTRHEEKRTDVAIGVHLINDLYSRSDFDSVTVVSSDSDLVAALEVARQVRDVEMLAAFPPRRGSADLKHASDSFRRVKAKFLEACMMPNPVSLPDGRAVWMPEEWVS